MIGQTGDRKQGSPCGEVDVSSAQEACGGRCAHILSRGGAYLILDHRSAGPAARLRPRPDIDRFERLGWPNVKGRSTIFGNLGRMKLALDSAFEIVEKN